jgi:hypothetical protein
MINTDTPGLLPCPFCGDRRVILSTRPMQPSKIVLHYIVECANCMARGPVAHVLQKKEEDRESACRRARKKAAEGWNNNRRTADMIREWMDQEPCTQCGVFFPKEDLHRTNSEVLCPDCYKEMLEMEEMLR